MEIVNKLEMLAQHKVQDRFITITCNEFSLQCKAYNKTNGFNLTISYDYINSERSVVYMHLTVITNSPKSFSVEYDENNEWYKAFDLIISEKVREINLQKLV